MRVIPQRQQTVTLIQIGLPVPGEEHAGRLTVVAMAHAAANDNRGQAWCQDVAEAALEAVAGCLEGDIDQVLVIRGTGADGDLRLVDDGGRLVLEAELLGEPAEIQEAALLLARALGDWARVEAVRLEWLRPEPARLPGGTLRLVASA
jgi:hypothetical protein